MNRSVEPLIEISNLGVARTSGAILKDINLHIYPGELHSIIGPNGAGKTTLMRSLLGSVRHSGRIKFHFRGGGAIGYLPQRFEFDLATPMSVGDMMALMLQSRPLPLGRARVTTQRIAELLALSGVEHLSKRRLGSLSGGELQRVLLAQALHPIPELLLLDEPVSHVDERGARQFELLLQQIRRQHDITILMVSHHLASTLRISDVISVLDRELVFNGSPRLFESSDTCYRLFGYREGGEAGSARHVPTANPVDVRKAG